MRTFKEIKKKEQKQKKKQKLTAQFPGCNVSGQLSANHRYVALNQRQRNQTDICTKRVVLHSQL